MSDDRFRPSVTVAAIIEQQGRFLLVQEHTPEGLRLNNPAGHLEQGESPLQAVQREALEETARRFTPQAFLGLYLARFERVATGQDISQDITYLRLAYRGSVSEPLEGHALDKGIVRTLWMSLQEVRASAAEHRSPLVLRCIEDHAAGLAYPLDTVQAHASLVQPWRPL
jgi:8-oxo-dGTP pyrophosphatase MutT (NUDIX family)